MAALAAIPAGLAGIALIKALGSWQMTALQTKLVTAGALARNLRLAGQGLLELFGADFFGAGPGRAVVFATDILGTREFSPVLPFAAVLAGRLLGERVLVAQYADLTAWLGAHHLTSGVSGYSQANIVTTESGGAISLRPVAAQGGYLTPRQWEGKRSWYDPGSQRANFVVLSTFGAYEVTAREAVATFGRPQRIYRYHDYTIMVWRENLFARLR